MLINNKRYTMGTKPASFIDLRAVRESGITRHITCGSNRGCETKGFTAVSGWNLITALGTSIPKSSLHTSQGCLEVVSGSALPILSHTDPDTAARLPHHTTKPPPTYPRLPPLAKMLVLYLFLFSPIADLSLETYAPYHSTRVVPSDIYIIFLFLTFLSIVFLHLSLWESLCISLLEY
ncbi:hypothetical protein DL93DRAFT_2077165, partial [Clavulina sp. PMI_390]